MTCPIDFHDYETGECWHRGEPLPPCFELNTWLSSSHKRGDGHATLTMKPAHPIPQEAPCQSTAAN